MRLPLITTPEPVESCGDCLAQGLKVSGARDVANTFTTELVKAFGTAATGSAAPAGLEGATACAKRPAGSAVARLNTHKARLASRGEG